MAKAPWWIGASPYEIDDHRGVGSGAQLPVRNSAPSGLVKRRNVVLLILARNAGGRARCVGSVSYKRWPLKNRRVAEILPDMRSDYRLLRVGASNITHASSCAGRPCSRKASKHTTQGVRVCGFSSSSSGDDRDLPVLFLLVSGSTGFAKNKFRVHDRLDASRKLTLAK